MSEHLPTRLGGVISALDRFSETIGRLVSWLVLGLVLLIGYDVIMRYLFLQGSIALQELEWHLFALLFLLAAAYTLKHDGHVRVDILYRSRLCSDYTRALIDLLGALVLLIPFCLLVIYSAWPFVESAWHHHEHSPDPGGLPLRWLIKGAIPLGFLLLLLQGVAEALRRWLQLSGTR